MKSHAKVVERLDEAVRHRNGELFSDAAIKVGLGVVFSLLTFGFIFWVGWVAGILFYGFTELSPVTFSAIFTGIFFAVACWSAWRNVNPLAELSTLTDSQRSTQALMAMISAATGTPMFFNPQLASAGFAMVLIGGPANILAAVGIWAHRLRVDSAILNAAAGMLKLCADGCSRREVASIDAAVLLRRLYLIKIAAGSTEDVIVLTERGRAMLKLDKKDVNRKREALRDSSRDPA